MRNAAFIKAAARGDLTTMEAMLQGYNPADVDYRPAYGNTALYVASDRGDLAMVQALLRAGADVNLQSRDRKWTWTALHAACYHSKSVELVKELLKAGADVNMVDSWGETPLLSLHTHAGPVDELRLQIARLLLEAKCDVNYQTQAGVTAMYLACHFDLSELIPLLVEYGAKIPSDAFFWCKPAAKLNTIVRLLEHGLEVNAQDFDGRTALFYAAERRRLDLVRLLLDHNADVSIADRKCECTALMAALTHNHWDGFRLLGTDEDQLSIVHLLLTRSSQLNENLIDRQDYAGSTALHYAANKSPVPILHELLNWRPNLTTLSYREGESALHVTQLSSISCVSIERLKCLFEHVHGYRADLKNIQDYKGRTVLHTVVACVSRYYSFIEYLSGVVDVRIRDVNGDTALHIAARRDQSKQYIDVLLRGHHGKDAANVRNNQGRTALMDAIIKRKTEAVMTLIRVTDIDISDVKGKTALHYAIQMKEFKYLYMLLKRDANFLVRDDEGHTALALACSLPDFDSCSQLTMIFQLYRCGVAYGEHLTMF